MWRLMRVFVTESVKEDSPPSEEAVKRSVEIRPAWVVGKWQREMYGRLWPEVIQN